VLIQSGVVGITNTAFTNSSSVTLRSNVTYNLINVNFLASSLTIRHVVDTYNCDV
jgi:hypothetical protein